MLAGALVIILAHELGHAALPRRYRLPVLAIDVTPIGGVCRYASARAFNFVILALNLLPVRPFDGATAWKLFRWKNLRRVGRRGTLRVRVAGLEREIEREKKKWLN